MNGHWKFSEHSLLVIALLLCLVHQEFSFCCSLNDEGLSLLRFRERVESDPFGALSNWKDGDGVENPCTWLGVGCFNGNVVSLDLKDLHLCGTLTPDLALLVHLKFIILRNNSFTGVIPDEIAKLKKLEILDLGYNNFSQPLPSDLCNNPSLEILLLDNTELFRCIFPGTDRPEMVPDVQENNNNAPRAEPLSHPNGGLSLRTTEAIGNVAGRKLLKVSSFSLLNNFQKQFRPVFRLLGPPEAGVENSTPSLSPSPSPNPSLSPAPTPSIIAEPHLAPSPRSSASPSSLPSPAKNRSGVVDSGRSHHRALILSAAIGGPILLFISIAGTIFFRSNKMAVVKPWATGLSGQLQRAFVTGVPKLKRSELESACENFSNVIGSSSVCTLYKGTLSSGVEIAVISRTVASTKDWSKDMEAQFRKKIDTLSKVNHKNFVSLLGYCEEEDPFTRMMVFEYAPNGTLFEHLHIREAEHLDWGMRMRITMGMAYCLEHMHNLSPSVPHKNLTSSAVYLTEDCAAKISDFGFWNETDAAEIGSSPESNVYSFGVILFEMMTGRLPYSANSSSLDDWASDYLRGGESPREMVDPTLSSFQEEQVERIADVIKMCVHPEPRRRLAMREVSARLREITGIGPDGATPRLSPLWWAELEIISTEAC
ncbi:Inactive receptor-like serine/threonine-protein kinase [Capsicum annuum]|uniref:Inactive receptor-like serine/threonine-protein kinase n=1 Tax=Capsicum annuum TaxID=4072 RepID=A0A1U8H3B1_CAPAN|nr:inactive receptor-like serine/threonine-protein kinase At2g40270 isoform X1 [Capsicum annuum]KAF3638584.1 Inactive receptor-like serine/threonine-protein kinase [Capsicum annuum]KAF3682112.1 Inactive receptor-like serine/threonine-protein kinase [Capsicum annuum]PHT78324.1 Inactive receptor-like serine/threonine-protein kinase [Capsicum annuum]